MSTDPKSQFAPRRYLSRLTRGTLAIIMAGGRGERLKDLTEDRCKPADAVRRQVPHHRFRAVELPEFRHPADLGADAVQGAFADPAHRQGLGIPARRIRRVHRDHPGAAAPRARVVPGHRRRAVAEHGPDSFAPAAARAGARGRSHLQDGLRPDDRLPRREGSGHHRRRRRGAARRRARVTACWPSTSRAACCVSTKSRRIRSPCPAGRTSRSRRWASMCSIRGCSSACCGPTPKIPTRRTTSARTSFRRRSRICACSPTRSRTCARKAQNYWRDVGTVDAYYEANMELVRVSPELNIYDEQWPIWTYQEQLPPAKFVFDDVDRRGCAVDSMVSGGCIISGSRVVQFAAVLAGARARLFARSIGR